MQDYIIPSSQDGVHVGNKLDISSSKHLVMFILHQSNMPRNATGCVLKKLFERTMPPWLSIHTGNGVRGGLV